MLKKILYFGLPVLATLLLVYYYLGGFNATQVILVDVDTEEYIVAGYSYQAPYREDELQNLFFMVKDYVETGALKGTITVLNYDSEIKPGDSIHQLIGIRLLSVPQHLPEDMQLDTVNARKAVRAKIEAHPLVMPNPEDTHALIQNFAEKESLVLREMTIEQYVNEKQLWVDIPLK